MDDYVAELIRLAEAFEQVPEAEEWQRNAVAIRAAVADLARVARERDAILQWSIRHAGWIGTYDLEACPPITRWWARSDNGRVEADTAEQVIRKAAGLDG